MREHKTRVHIPPLVLLAVGFWWLALDFYLIVGPTILRETRLGFIAQFLDKLPCGIGNTIDAILPTFWMDRPGDVGLGGAVSSRANHQMNSLYSAGDSRKQFH